MKTRYGAATLFFACLLTPVGASAQEKASPEGAQPLSLGTRLEAGNRELLVTLTSPTFSAFRFEAAGEYHSLRTEATDSSAVLRLSLALHYALVSSEKGLVYGGIRGEYDSLERTATSSQGTDVSTHRRQRPAVLVGGEYQPYPSIGLGAEISFGHDFGDRKVGYSTSAGLLARWYIGGGK